MKLKFIALTSFVLGYASVEPGKVLYLDEAKGKELQAAGLIKPYEGEEEDFVEVDERLYTGEESPRVVEETVPEGAEESTEEVIVLAEKAKKGK